MAKRAWAGAALIVSLAGLFAAFLLDRLAPFPSADVARGSEEAFASGLHLREFTGPRKTPERWTSERVLVRFSNLPAGPRVLEVALHQQRSPVAIAVDGVIVGSLAPQATHAEVALPGSSRSGLTVELRGETFVAGNARRLGAHFDRVALRHERGGLPPAGLLLAMLAVPLGVVVAARFSGSGPKAAAVLALSSLAACAALLWPMGLLRSSYATGLPLLILGSAALAFGFARWRAARAGALAAPWAFAALLCALLVQGVTMTSPMVVMSDAVLHANKVLQVAGGDFFPVSLTQHARPFQFPYGVSFYALLRPLLPLGFDAVSLVRTGAGISGALSAAVLFVIGEKAPRRAALAVVLLQTLPISCDSFAYGNLSNIFGQSVTLAFLGWWLVPLGGAGLGALLLLVAALAHLSSLIVLALLVPILLLRERKALPARRVRALAVGLAALLAALYYAHFIPLIGEQLPRLLEGGGSGRRALGLFEAMLSQVEDALGRWGWPATLLAILGVPRPSRGEPDRMLTAVWCTGAALALVAVISPIEVRYLYAMGFAVSVAASNGVARLSERGRLLGFAGWGLVAWQGFLALQGIREIVVERYRL